MIILTRSQFLALPAGYVYAKYAPCVFDFMAIKGDTIYSEGKAIDWFYQNIIDAVDADDTGEHFAKLDDSMERGTSVPMDFECESRDGCFDDDQLFAVFDPADVAALIQRLSHCIPPITTPSAAHESNSTKEK